MKGSSVEIRKIWDWGWSFATERREIRYIESGLLGVVDEYVSFLLIFWPTGWLYFSSSASYMISAIGAFFLHKYWSFKGDQKHKGSHQVMAFMILATANFFISNALIGLFVYKVGVRPSYSKLLAIGLTAIWSFLLSNYVIFRHKKPIA